MAGLRPAHHGVVTALGEQYQPAPLFNAAYVSGTHYGQGVSASRYYTSGDKPAPDLFDKDIMAYVKINHRMVSFCCFSL